jgi:hypothetical protein
MTAANISRDTLVGQTFDCVFGAFVPRLTFNSTKQLRVQALIGGAEIDQVVPVELTGVRPNVFIVSWVEDNGNFIVQLQDHENGVVHNHARLADGQVFRAEGKLQPVPQA